MIYNIFRFDIISIAAAAAVVLCASEVARATSVCP